MNKETIYLEHDFEDLYGHISDNIVYEYFVEYDWDDILNNNFNDTNFKIFMIGIPKKYDYFFSNNHIDKNEWEKQMVQFLSSSTAYEDFLENIDEKMASAYEKKWN